MHEGFVRSVAEDHFTEVNPALVRMPGCRLPEEVLALFLAQDVYADPPEREQVRAQFDSSGVVNGKKAQWM